MDAFKIGIALLLLAGVVLYARVRMIARGLDRNDRHD